MRRWLVLVAVAVCVAAYWWWPSEEVLHEVDQPPRTQVRVQRAPVDAAPTPEAIAETTPDAPVIREVEPTLRFDAGSPVNDEVVVRSTPRALDVENALPKQTRAEELERASKRVTSPGLCEDEKKSRDALLASFKKVELELGSLRIDPVLPEVVVTRVVNALLVARERSSALIAPGASVAAPEVIVYRSLNQLRSVSCVNTSAFGYYDGAIHLSGNPNGGLTQLEETLVHEYVHHVLVQQRVRLPTWLAEGAAILIAGETWWRAPELELMQWARSTYLPFDDLVPAFAHATDERLATHIYFQSFLMVEFIRSRRGVPGITALIARLSAQLVSPDDAFAEAVGLERSAVGPEFQSWVQRAQLF